MQELYSRERMKWIRNEYEDWWSGKREKPLINLAFSGEDPHMVRPAGLITDKTFLYDLNEPAEKIVEKMEYSLRSYRYELHGYPVVTVNFGAGYKVEFLGCRPTIGHDTVWFKAPRQLPAREVTLRRDPESVLLPRVKELYQAIDRHFEDGYVISGVGLSKYGPGSAFSTVAEYFGSEEMAYLMYDEPEEIKRLTAEAARSLDEIGEELYTHLPHAIGFSGWSDLYAPEPWSILLCDFSALIGPQHFDEFLLDDLVRGVECSPRYNFYHLDGPGEIIHMDKILAIPDLKCMQWVPLPEGPLELTLDVCNRIHRAGRNQWVVGPIERAIRVARHNGTARGIYWKGVYPMSEYDRVMKLADELMNL